MISGKDILVVYSSKNSEGLNDATGAFIPGAQAFAKLHGVVPENMCAIPCPDLSAKKRLEELCVFLRQKRNIKWLTLFGHGYSGGLQFGLTKQNIVTFAGYLNLSCALDLKVTLYACSTASTSKNTRNINAPGTDNGYADKLRDKLLELGFKGGWIDAHLTPGHTTDNPFVMRFYTEPRFETDWDLPGGTWLVSPKSQLWSSWKHSIQEAKGTFRYEFGAMTESEIYTRLAEFPK